MTDATAREGLLLFAHGARDPNWARPFEAVRARLRELAPGVEVGRHQLQDCLLYTSDAADE